MSKFKVGDLVRGRHTGRVCEIISFQQQLAKLSIVETGEVFIDELSCWDAVPPHEAAVLRLKLAAEKETT